MKEEWRFAIRTVGALSVMIHGIGETLWLYADS